MNVAVDFKNVDIMFGPDTRDALAMVDKGATRNEILEKTGNVLGCAGASLTVNEGEISVLMGLSGSGKSTLLRAVNRLNIVSRGQVLVREGDKMVDVVSCDEPTLRSIERNLGYQAAALKAWGGKAENLKAAAPAIMLGRAPRSYSAYSPTTAKQAARTTGRRAEAEATRLEALARQAERAQRHARCAPRRSWCSRSCRPTARGTRSSRPCRGRCR